MSDTLSEPTLAQSLYQFLKENVHIGAPESNDLRMLSIGDPDGTWDERKVVHQLAQILASPEGRKLLPQGTMGADDPVNHIADIDQTWELGKSEYTVPQDFVPRLIRAYINPHVEAAIASWPEFRHEPATSSKLIGAFADFDPDFGNDKATSLFKFTHDGSCASKPIIQENIKYKEVTQIDKELRPIVIYFGGMISASEKPSYINRAMGRVRRLGNSLAVKQDGYDIYVATYSNGASSRKRQHILSYIQDPEHYASDNARKVVHQYMQPLFTRETKGGKIERVDSQTLMHNFSLLNLVGYSYGTNFVQEVRNALVEEMQRQELGYTAAEIHNALRCVSALNLGPVAHVVDKSKTGDFTQFFACAEGDPSTAHYSNIADLVKADPNPHLKQHIIYEGKEPNIVVAMGCNIPNKIVSYKTKPLFSNDDLGSSNVTRVHVIDDSAEPIAQENASRHHIDGFLKTTRLRRDDDNMIFSVNPVSEVLRMFFRDQLEGSVNLIDGVKPYRDAPKILQHMMERYLTSEAIDRIVGTANIGRRDIAHELQMRREVKNAHHR